MAINYDQTDPASIEQFAKRLEDSTLRRTPGVHEIPKELLDRQVGARLRGGFGGLVETYYFGIEPGNEAAPDFKEAGVELKTTPLILKNNRYKSKERLVIQMIDFRQVHHEENFDDSSLWHKMHRTLLLMYVHRDGAYFGDLEFKHARLLHLPEKDLQVIKRDWRKIKEMVDMGLAHEITEGMTHYLGACTKAANSASRTTQPCSSESAKPRAFSLKQSYMNSIVSQLQDAGSIITAPEHLSEKETFEDVVLRKIQPHFGRSVDEIHKEVGGELRKKAKSYYAALAKRLIGIEAKKVEEFEKANISIKTIRLKKNGMPKEAMSFPAFDYFDLLNETWEDDKENTAKIKECLEQRFFFVVFQYTNDIRGDDLVLKTAFFWTMPRLDLDGPIKDLWEETKCRIANGMADQLPSSADNPVGHVRPHGRDSSDTLTTPHDGVLVKKSFWLNQLYLKDVISKNYEQN